MTNFGRMDKELSRKNAGGTKNATEKQIEKGDLVFLTEDEKSPLHWPLGVLTEVYSGNDDLIRVTKMKLAEKITIEAMTKLRHLPRY